MNSKRSRATVGIRLSRGALQVLRERGIFAQSSVGLEHQHLAKRYVVRGLKSDGAAGDVGHYVTFAREDGWPVECFCPIETIGVNGPHAVVLGPVLVRIEMLRKATTYELLITQHRPSPFSNGTRPLLEAKILFRGSRAQPSPERIRVTCILTHAWNWICQERTKHEPVQSYRLSVLGVEMRSAYRDVFGRQFAPLRRRKMRRLFSLSLHDGATGTRARSECTRGTGKQCETCRN